jgi:hypothetical protein
METLRYVLLANGLLVVVSVAFYLLLRRETFFQINRLMLWLGILSVLILPALQFPDWRPQRVRFAMQHTAQVIAPKVLPPAPTRSTVTITLPNGRSYPVAHIRRLARFGWSWQLALISAYLLGLLLLTGRFALQLLSIWRLIQCSERDQFDAFTLVTNPSVSAPFSFLRWVVLNPASHTGDELDQILRHERIHVRQRHSLDMLMAEGVCIVFWLNPAAYLFRRLVHQTLEFCADQAVLAEGIDARTYQYNLLKVSMASGSLPITNSFSASQLHDRIRMINRQRSRWFQALKYPVVVVLSLTMVTTFARHKAEQMATQVVAPVAQSIKSLSEMGFSPISKQDTALLVKAKLKGSVANPTALPATLISHSQLALPDSVSALASIPGYDERPSDSRLVIYKDNILYWIITPKTTLEDFSQLQKELAKHRNKLQLKSIKYDPSYLYIDQIDVQVAQIGGGSVGSWDTTADGGKPIKTIAGYLSVGSQRGSRGIGSLVDFPEELRHVGFNDEAAVKTELDTYGSEYLVRAGEIRFRSVGNGSTRYDRAYFDNNSTRGSGIIVKSDRSLVVDDDSKAATIYINNEPVDANAVGLWTVDKLYAVVKKTKYDSVYKRTVTVALLLYMMDK